MANTKISNLSAVTSFDDEDELVLARAGTSNKIDALYLPGFELAYAERTSNLTVSATTSAAAQDVVSAGAVTFDGSRYCIEFYAYAVGTGASAGNATILTLWDSSSEGPRMFAIQGTSILTGCFARRFLTPSAGSHTYTVKAWRNVANGTVYAGDGVGAEPEMMPAYIRITKA